MLRSSRPFAPTIVPKVPRHTCGICGGEAEVQWPGEDIHRCAEHAIDGSAEAALSLIEFGLTASVATVVLSLTIFLTCVGVAAADRWLGIAAPADVALVADWVLVPLVGGLGLFAALMAADFFLPGARR